MRPFAPLPPDHPAVEQVCAACHKGFARGDVTTLVALGPGDDAEARQRAADGHAYNAVAALVHWACATGSTDPEGDWEAWKLMQG